MLSYSRALNEYLSNSIAVVPAFRSITCELTPGTVKEQNEGPFRMRECMIISELESKDSEKRGRKPIWKARRALNITKKPARE